jgi:hypothetical protein
LQVRSKKENVNGAVSNVELNGRVAKSFFAASQLFLRQTFAMKKCPFQMIKYERQALLMTCFTKSYFFKFKNYHPLPWRDSISRSISPISSVAGGDDVDHAARSISM